MLILYFDLCSSSSYIDIYIGSEDALNVVWQQNMYTSQCAVKAYVHALLSKSVSWKFRVHLLTKKFSRGKGGGGRGAWENLCTVNCQQYWVWALSSTLLKRLRHTSIKLKSAKWVFLRDLHRLNCNGFLFLVSPAAIMMWPLLLLLLLLLLRVSVLLFLLRLSF